MLLDADIAYNDTLFLYVPLFCVVQDCLLMLIDADIVNKDTLFLHE